MPSTAKVVTLEARDLHGMMRQMAETKLPPDIARLARDLTFRGGTAKGRPGALSLYTAADISVGGRVFDGTTARYGEFADVPAYDLGTKWAIVVWFKTAGTPGSTQTILSRDVTPVSPGDKTFEVTINSSRQVGFVSDLVGGASANLAAAAGSVVAAATKVGALVYRDGATLALHLDGNPTAALTNTSLPATTKQIAGAQPIMVAQTYDGASRTQPFDGSIGLIAIFRDFTSVADLLRYTTFQKYPDPMDPRVILYVPFHETGATMTDWSTIGNDGTLTGSPANQTEMGIQTKRGQRFFSMADPETGTLRNFALIAGTLYGQTIRSGS